MAYYGKIQRLLVIVIVFGASFVVSYLVLYWRFYYGNFLVGECFVTIVQSGVNPKDLDVKSPRRMYAYSIVENCQAMYGSCSSLYRNRNVTCVLDWNVCRCVEDGLR